MPDGEHGGGSKRVTRIAVTAQDIVRRARSCTGEGRYGLGAGGRDPLALTPLVQGLCDCSGFAAWCVGLDRYQPGQIEGDWVETSAVYSDAVRPCHMMFAKVTPASGGPQPGDLIVYPDRGLTQGHIGVISEVQASMLEPIPALDLVKSVVHCSKGNQRLKGVAIAETGPEVFVARAAIVVRYIHSLPTSER